MENRAVHPHQEFPEVISGILSTESSQEMLISSSVIIEIRDANTIVVEFFFFFDTYRIICIL